MSEKPTQEMIDAGVVALVQQRGVTQFTPEDLVCAYTAMKLASAEQPEKIDYVKVGLEVELGAAKRKIAELETENAKLKSFARDIMVLAHDAMDLNGGDVEEIALKHGLLKSVEVFEPCSEVGCICAEVGDFPLYCNRTTELIAEPKESRS